MMWIDSHCHLDASEFDPDRLAVREAARQAGVLHCLIPSVHRANFEVVRELAHTTQDMYALGIHPLYVPEAQDEDLYVLAEQLDAAKDDPRCVAVGEIGLDFFVPRLCEPALREKQWRFYLAQLKLAKQNHLPVVLHVRKSADQLLQGLRQTKFTLGGIAHAFNGSFAQAQRFIDLGFKLGFGGTLTFERALQIRRLATQLPLGSIVLETDAPDIPPHWLYQTAAERNQRLTLGQALARNSSAELPRIGACLAQLRQQSETEIAQATTENCRDLFRRFFFLD